jgi:K+ transporter
MNYNVLLPQQIMPLINWWLMQGMVCIITMYKPSHKLKAMNELNIGHAIVAHALFVGFKAAVKEMKDLMIQARA